MPHHRRPQGQSEGCRQEDFVGKDLQCRSSRSNRIQSPMFADKISELRLVSPRITFSFPRTERRHLSLPLKKCMQTFGHSLSYNVDPGRFHLGTGNSIRMGRPNLGTLLVSQIMQVSTGSKGCWITPKEPLFSVETLIARRNTSPLPLSRTSVLMIP
jgi:hypothetical protein